MYQLFSRLAAPPGILLPSVGRSVSIATWIVLFHERYYLNFHLVAGGGALFSKMIPKIVKNVLSKRTTGRILLSHADFFLHWWVFPFLFVSAFITSPFFPWMSEHQRRKRYFADENWNKLENGEKTIFNSLLLVPALCLSFKWERTHSYSVPIHNYSNKGKIILNSWYPVCLRENMAKYSNFENRKRLSHIFRG